MKILHILDQSLPVHSGYTFRSHEILRVQSRNGWQPVVLTTPKQETRPDELWRPKEVIDGVTYYRTMPTSAITESVRSAVGFMTVLAARIREVVREEKPDILHAHSPVLNAIPTWWIGRRLGLPVLYEIRAFWEDAAVDHGSYARASWKYRLVRFLETRMCRAVDHVFVICGGLRDDLIERNIPSGKIHVVGNGIDSESFQAGDPDAEYVKSWGLEGKTVIGFVGSFYRYEGLDLLIDAFARLATARRDVVLLLVGGGMMERDLRSQVVRLGLEKRVILPGRIPHQRIPGAYAVIDVLVYPRYSTRLTELVTPLKPLEAMAVRKPLVASDVGGHRELIADGSTGLLFASGSVDALAGALQRILDDKSLRESLAAQGWNWVHRTRPWEMTTVAYADVYSGLLSA